MSNLFLELMQASGKTCRYCEHRQRHEAGSKVFQYCGVRKSNRTNNGLLKISVKTLACPKYVEKQK